MSYSKYVPTITACAIALLGFLQHSRAQDEAVGNAVASEALLDYYRESVVDEQAAKLGANPKIAEYIALGEHARALVHTGNAQTGQTTILELQKVFSSKMRELLHSDLGRYVATEREAVRACLQLENATKEFSAETIAERYRRLGSSLENLRNYSPGLGDFDPNTNVSASAILADAAWVNNYFSKLKKQVALLAKFESAAASDAKEADPSTLASKPTLRRAMDSYEADQLLAQLDNDTSAKEVATAEASAVRRAADAEIIKKQALDEVEAKNKIAAVARELLAAETDFSAAQKKLEIASIHRQEQSTLDAAKMEQVRAAIDKAGAEQQRIDAEEIAEREKVIQYLQSARVKQVLAPFCNPGRYDASSHPGLPKKIEELGNHPMSLSRMAECKCLAPTESDMLRLISVANHDNDRPGWPVSHQTWDRIGEKFRDMNGNNVNACTEAQRILRDHGGLLVELKMLRP